MSAKTLSRVGVRWMIRRDHPEVLLIERASFASPWTEEDLLHCLSQRNCIGMVAEQGEKVIGFMIYELHKTKLHILNFAVHPDWRRSGVGTAMMDKVKSKLCSSRRTGLVADVGEWNTGGHYFMRACGFRAVRVLRRYYEDTGDAYRFKWRLREPGGEG